MTYWVCIVLGKKHVALPAVAVCSGFSKKQNKGKSEYKCQGMGDKVK